jgi:hypothetical protein
MLVVPSSLVDTIDEHGKRHLPGEFMLNFTAPAAVELVLNLFAPLSGGAELFS